MNTRKAWLYAITAALAGISGYTSQWAATGVWPDSLQILNAVCSVTTATIVTLKAYESNPSLDPTVSNPTIPIK